MATDPQIRIVDLRLLDLSPHTSASTLPTGHSPDFARRRTIGTRYPLVLDSFDPRWHKTRRNTPGTAQVTRVAAGPISAVTVWSDDEWPALELATDDGRVLRYVIAADQPFTEVIWAVFPHLAMWATMIEMGHHGPSNPNGPTDAELEAGWALLDDAFALSWEAAAQTRLEHVGAISWGLARKTIGLDTTRAGVETHAVAQWEHALALIRLDLAADLPWRRTPVDVDALVQTEVWRDWEVWPFAARQDFTRSQGSPIVVGSDAIVAGHRPAGLAKWLAGPLSLTSSAPVRDQGHDPDTVADIVMTTSRANPGQTKHAETACIDLLTQISPDRATLVAKAGLAATDPACVTATDEHLRFLAALRPPGAHPGDTAPG